ncbi:MAG: DNA-protecting protein DprA [Deltaproteobacteria bacterium]|nr:DNA-protecting protein DprA [Deltaproteobacteria bacterium]
MRVDLKRRLIEVGRRFSQFESSHEGESWADKIISWCKGHDCLILPFEQCPNIYLKEIGSVPDLLFLKGEVDTLGEPCLALVGTRRPSNYGKRAAIHFSRALSARGFCIVSGLARGIDSLAHQGVIDVGGHTVAVLGHGLDRIYPGENLALAHEIVRKGGCLVSEYPPGVPPLKNHFPARNRIISGLSLGTVIVEAAARSGSLITARCALEQNREIFAVPAHYDDLGFYGCHRLLQEGAKLITSVEEILEELPPQASFPIFEQSTKETAAEEAGLKEILGVFAAQEGVISLDELYSKYPSNFSDLLDCLEVGIQKGLIYEISPQHFAWIGKTGDRTVVSQA